MSQEPGSQAGKFFSDSVDEFSRGGEMLGLSRESQQVVERVDGNAVGLWIAAKLTGADMFPVYRIPPPRCSLDLSRSRSTALIVAARLPLSRLRIAGVRSGKKSASSPRTYEGRNLFLYAFPLPANPLTTSSYSHAVIL